jgi:methylated-DNA-[protein]-cysteine S-methyltransferase
LEQRKESENLAYICKIASPVGGLTASSDGASITGLWIEGQKYFAATLPKNTIKRDLPVFQDLRRWLDCYFEGEDPNFTLPLLPSGSAFRKSVWNILCEIPHGKTITYGDIASRLGKHPRPVGGAVGHNPISIIIPCHRVVGANGSLTGYAGGIDKKTQLLRLEKVLK